MISVVFGVVVLVLFAVVFSGSLTGYFLSQETYTLDLNEFSFLYRETSFNDTEPTKDIDFPDDGGTETYYVDIPKNSTVLTTGVNLTGEITTVYKREITEAGVEGLSVGDVTGDGDNEIVSGRKYSTQGDSSVFLVEGDTGDIIWTYDEPPATHTTYSTDIGDVTGDGDNEVVFANEDNDVYVLDKDGNELWTYTTGGDARTVEIADVTGDENNEIIAGSEDTRLYVLGGEDEVVWNVSTEGVVRDVSTGNLLPDEGLDIAVATGNHIRIYNRTGHEKFSKDTERTVTTIKVSSIVESEWDEIVVGDDTDYEITVYNITSEAPELDVVWSKSLDYRINSVEVYDIITESPYSGEKEIVAGTHDNKRVHVFSNDGDLIWDFQTESYVHSVTAGNLMPDLQGDEVAAGDGNLYIFNFEYFPTNASLDIGDQRVWESADTKLRESERAEGFEESIQDFLEDCSPVEGVCSVPFTFGSDFAGRLNVSNLDVEYRYNVSDIVTKENADWSRTRNIMVNESIGSESIKLNFEERPVNDVEVRYINVSQDASVCDFNGTQYDTVETSEGYVCDIDSFVLYSTQGDLPEPVVFWDDTMPQDVPVLMNSSEQWFTEETDDYSWRKNHTIWSTSNQVFENVTANATIDEEQVAEDSFLEVYVDGFWMDLTPDEEGDCHGDDVEYVEREVEGETFYVCKEDTDQSGVVDFFKWKQPETSSMNYIVGGSTNYKPVIENTSVDPETDIWGSKFDFYVDVEDKDGDNVNVTLFVKPNQSGQWIKKGTDMVEGQGTATFEDIQSDMDWSGNSTYKFEYFDYSPGDPVEIFHSPVNTTDFHGPMGQRHSVSVEHIQGNETSVNRSEETYFEVAVIDEEEGFHEVGENVSLSFWVTEDGESWDSGNQSLTNETGHGTYNFSPGQNYSVGSQIWKAGVADDEHYMDTNTTEFLVDIHGLLNVDIHKPLDGDVLLRNTASELQSGLVDQYGEKVSEEGHDCSYYYNGEEAGSGGFGDGVCMYSWEPDCDVDRGGYSITVEVGGESQFYTVVDGIDSSDVEVWDSLDINITDPQSGSLQHKNKTIDLGSEVNDSCEGVQIDGYTANWSLVRKDSIRIGLTENMGLNRTDEPLRINGSWLEEIGVDFSNWRVNDTRIVSDGNVSMEVRPWTDEKKEELDYEKEYVDNYTDIVFLVDLETGESRDYRIMWNESNQQPQDRIHYIENGGFEGGSLSGWNYTDGTPGSDDYNDYVFIENDSYSGNYSAHVFAFDGKTYLNITVPGKINSEYLSLVYKAWGTFDDERTATVYAGEGSCHMDFDMDRLREDESTWNSTTCYNGSFVDSDWISVVVEYDGNAGYGRDAPHLLVDSICISDEYGECLTPQSGAPLDKDVVFRDWVMEDDGPWEPDISELVGDRRLYASADGEYYVPNFTTLNFDLYGWSEVGDIDLTSDYCTLRDDSWICGENADVRFDCGVYDSHSSGGIGGYYVDFYNDTDKMGTNITLDSGLGYHWFQTSEEGEYNLTCNITDQSSVFYNVTSTNEGELTFVVDSGNTTGTLLQEPSFEEAEDITRLNNHTFGINLTVKSEGSLMLSPEITVDTEEGIYVEDVQCPPLDDGENCTRTAEVNVTQYADPGTTDINTTLHWTNSDGSENTTENSTILEIMDNTALNIMEDTVNSSESAGFEGVVANFSVEAFGNTEVENVTINMTNVSNENIYNWTSVSGNIGDIERGHNKTVDINATLPMDIEPGLYTADIVANATNSTCSPEDRCWDVSVFNLTVDIPDWYIEKEPEFMNKTIGTGDMEGVIGQVEIFNNIEENSSFDVYFDGNGTEGHTDYITTSKQTVEVANQSSVILEVVHQRGEEDYENGTYVADITLEPIDDLIPSYINFTATLDIVDLTVDVLNPTKDSHEGPLNVGDEVELSVNVTRLDDVVDDDVEFDVWVDGEMCTKTDEPFHTLSAAWIIKCEVPWVPGNPIKNSIRVAATHDNLTSYGENEDSVIYKDVVSPVFSDVYVDPIDKDTVRDYGYKEIEVDITDNTGVDEAWVGIDIPNGVLNITDYERNGDRFIFNLTESDFDGTGGEDFPVGDYDITVYANDTGELGEYSDLGGGLVNSTRGWFSVYEPVDLRGSLDKPTGDNISANFTFYREGREFWPHPIHEFTVGEETSEFDWEVHRRGYDMNVEVFGQEIIFESLDINDSTSGDELQDPLQFDYIPDSDAADGALRTISRKFQNPIFGIVVEADENLTFSRRNITMDFSGRSLGGVQNTENLRVLKCSEWDYQYRDCNITLGEEHYFDYSPSTQENTLNFLDEEPGSAYILAEACISDGELIDCAGYTPDDTGDTGDSGGNGAMPGEEEDPFPFDLETNLDSVDLFPGDMRSFWIMLTNNIHENLTVDLEPLGDVSDWLEFEESSIELESTSSRTLEMDLQVPVETGPGTFSGDILLSARGRQRTLPFEVNVLEEGDEYLSLDVNIVDDEVERGDNVTFRLELNTESTNELDIEATYTARGPDNRTVVEAGENVTFTGSYSGFRQMEIPEDTEPGKYNLEVWAKFDNKGVRDMQTFHVLETFWATTAGQALLFLGLPIAILAIVISTVHLKGKYKEWKKAKEEQQRYLFPVDDNAIPQKSDRSFWIGKLAGGNKKAYYNPDDLKTHALVAGATGAGKSVGASVFAEEALDQGIPVVVFDPTAQWTGFVNQCEDEELLKHYSHHGMDKRKRRSYPGMIHKMDDPDRDIDFQELTQEGEITVFTLNELSTEEFDRAVRNIIDSMFEINWEESEELKLVVVFDEVHRLLEKYGGKGGYKALERACREFRKWGIGLIMCSQVLADFKEAIEGNVLTDVQFNTKAIKDIRKAKDKYGEKYAKRITRQGIGVCMMQHAQYNDGDPWFVRFRPTWHNPHKLKEEELKKYEEFAEKLDELEAKVDDMDDRGEDVFDLRTSLRMAKNKLKSGNFRMTEIYINSLEDKLK